MDPAWEEELERLEARVIEAVGALLDHSGADGATLELVRPGVGEPTYVVISPADAWDSMDPRREPEWRTGPDVPDEVLAALPEPVREGLEELLAEDQARRGARKH